MSGVKMLGAKMSGVKCRGGGGGGGGGVKYIRNNVLCLYSILYHSFYLKIENYH